MISVLPPQSPTQLSSLSAHVGPALGRVSDVAATVDTAALS